MKHLLTFILIGMFFVKAYWTGKSRYVTTVTGRSAISCEYDYNGTKFWRVFEFTCPTSVDVY